MANPFVGEIRMFPFNFPPKGWAFCQGQLLAISQNTALFSLLGTYYGGDGKSTFALPNLKDSAPLHTDQFSGGGNYPIGAAAGEAAHALIQTEIPSHSHTLNCSDAADSRAAAGNTPAKLSEPVTNVYATSPNDVMNPGAVAAVGASAPHNNMQPYLTLNFCIALQGVYPPRT